MKKVLLFAITLILVIGLLPANVFAGSNPVVSIEKRAQEGNTVEFDIVLSGSSGFNDLSIELSFDSGTYEFISISNVLNIGTKSGSKKGDNVINLSWASNNVMHYNGVLATLKLQLSNNAEGFCPVKISYLKNDQFNYIDGVNVNYIGNSPLNLQYKNGGVYVGNAINWDNYYLFYAKYDSNGKMISIKTVDYSIFFNSLSEGKLFTLSKQTCMPENLNITIP